MNIKHVLFAALVAVFAASVARAADPLIRAAAVCPDETGGVQYELCIDLTAEMSGLWQCSTETCEGAGWLRGDTNDTGSFSGATIMKTDHTSKSNGVGAVWSGVDQEAYDVGGWHTGTNAYLTVPSGVTHVRLCAGALINKSGLGAREMEVQTGGAHKRGLPSFHLGGQQQDGDQSGFSSMTVCGGVVETTEGTQYQMWYKQSTGGVPVNLAGTSGGFDNTFLSIQAVR